MPYYRMGYHYCSYCREIFSHEEDASHHEKHYCAKSPYVEDAWDESHLNPANKRCATCEHSSSFLSIYGEYEADFAGYDCPQRLEYESRRKFPCPAYVRCVSIADVDFDTREFTEIARRYYRSFGLKESRVRG